MRRLLRILLHCLLLPVTLAVACAVPARPRVVLGGPVSSCGPAIVAESEDDGTGRTSTESGEVVASGKASWYGKEFAGKSTANGEKFDPAGLTAAHKSLPFGTRLRVVNTATDASVVVRVNDRFPGTGGRVIDLSEAAFAAIAPLTQGIATVRVERLP